MGVSETATKSCGKFTLTPVAQELPDKGASDKLKKNLSTHRPQRRCRTGSGSSLSYTHCVMRVRSLLTLFVSAVTLSGQPLLRHEAVNLRIQSTIRVDSDLVLVPTVVTDKDYRPVFRLGAEQFRLTVDKVETPIAAVWTDTGPLSVVIVFDASKSMRDVLTKAKHSVDGFFRLAHPDDEYALIVCQDHGRLDVPFTTDLGEVRSRILSASAEGSTPLYDSVQLAIEVARKARHERRAILVISDAEDTSSRLSYKSLWREALESTAYIYVLQLWTGGYVGEGPEFRSLRPLADLTGGVFYDNLSAKRFAEYFERLDLHQRYVVAFHPTAMAHDNRRHQLEVRVREGAVQSPKLFWRHAYVDTEVGGGE